MKLQSMKGRPATQLEIEAMGSICSLQDELYEACKIIRALLGAPPPRIWEKWPNLHKQATEYLRESNYNNAPSNLVNENDDEN